MESPIPTASLTDGLVLLRPPVMEDAFAVPEAIQDPEILRWQPSIPNPYTIGHARQWIESAQAQWREVAPARLDLMITCQETGKLLGAAGFIPSAQNRIAEISYWLRRSARGRGLGTGSVRLLSRWILLDRGYEGASIMISAANTSSLRLAERCGFEKERECAGVFRYVLYRKYLCRSATAK